MTTFSQNPERHEETPNEVRISRRAIMAGALGAALTPVAGLLAPASAQSTLKQAAGIGDLLAGIPNMCRVTSATIEGPYYIDQRIVRSDIREGQPGVPLELELGLVNANAGCGPVSGALISIWHCNAAGQYSGYLFNDPNVMPDVRAANAAGHVPERDAERWLRGAQTTDANGKVTFRTIVPGWYTPRTAHIHVRAFLNERTMITTQLYLPQTVNNTVQSTHPAYKARGVSIYTNENDILIRPEEILKVSALDNGSLRAAITLGAGHV